MSDGCIVLILQTSNKMMVSKSFKRGYFKVCSGIAKEYSGARSLYFKGLELSRRQHGSISSCRTW